MIPLIVAIGGLSYTNVPQPFMTVEYYSRETYAAYPQKLVVTDDLGLAQKLWRDHGVLLYLYAEEIQGLVQIASKAKEMGLVFDGYCVVIRNIPIDIGAYPISGLAKQARSVAEDKLLMFGVDEPVLAPFSWDIANAAKYVNHWLLMGEKYQGDPSTIREWAKERRAQVRAGGLRTISVQFVTYGKHIGFQTVGQVYGAMKKVAGLGMYGCHIDDTKDVTHPVVLAGVYSEYYGY